MGGREPPGTSSPDRSNGRTRSTQHLTTPGRMMKDLRDWYSYLEKIADQAASSSPSPPETKVTKVFRIPSAEELLAGDSAKPRQANQPFLPVDGHEGPGPRRPGRRPLTETREEIVKRLLDPELTLHEAAALLNLSKATVRRYTILGKLQCSRTVGGQRRFKLSDLVAFLETGRPPRSRQRQTAKMGAAP